METDTVSVTLCFLVFTKLDHMLWKLGFIRHIRNSDGNERLKLIMTDKREKCLVKGKPVLM
jgi:metal-sulfur cluster biosynthetic enzyme